MIELIDCLYQTQALDEALKYIGEAENEGLRPAQVAFLKGLVLLKNGDGDGAITSFTAAKEIDKSLAQSCDYQIGLCYLKSKKYGDAKKAFQQIKLVDPQSNLASLANEYMDAIERKEDATRPFRFGAGVSWQYDDNVVLKPSDTSIATNIADKADSREVYTANAEYNHNFSDMIGIKAQYLFYYGKQNNLGFYDTVSNTFAAQPTITLKNGIVSFPSGYSHTLVNDKAYLSSPFTSGYYNFMIGARNMGQIYIKYASKDYLWDPSMPDEDRDGDDFGGGAGWYFFFMKNKGFLFTRYGVNKETTDGNNWDYIGNRVSATVLVPVHEKVNVSFSGDALIQSFQNTNSIFNVRRSDKVYSVSSLVAYKFYKECEVKLQYTFVKDDSNISIYDYNRNIFSVGVEGRF